MTLLTSKESKETAYISGDVSESTIKRLNIVKKKTGKQQKRIVREAVKAWLEGKLNLEE